MWRKILIIPLILIFVLFMMCSCSTNNELSKVQKPIIKDSGSFEGMLVSYGFDENNKVCKATLDDISENGDGSRYEIFFNDKTEILPAYEEYNIEINPDDFYEGKYLGTGFSGTYYKENGKCYAEKIYLSSAITDESMKLKDGTKIIKWFDGKGKNYTLEDGTSLLYTCISYTDFDYNMKSFVDSLPEEIMNNIHSYFDNQGEMFDKNSILEENYAKYIENSDYFDYLNQSTKPVEYDNENIYYITYINYGKTDGDATEYHFVFDINSGELVSTDYK